ncbi:hypothetical protein TIFTF001_040408 [Ficus carica]|uniref:DDE Tnp4 domain-containing protein n=1 Tax=Ficus carica TaxID=3494 RepID=A0AA88CN69_FICCA|nr:hypothetical protein TIFTF001_040408 [Ficus carica]
MNEFSSASEHEEDDQSSENELSDDDGFLAMAVIVVAVSRLNRRRDPQPMHNSRLTSSMQEIFTWLTRDTRIRIVSLVHFDGRRIIYTNIRNVAADWAPGGKYLITCTHLCRIALSRLLVIKILKGINNYPMKKQVMIPVACAIVHNFIRMVQVRDPIFEEYLTDGVPVGGHVDVNADVKSSDGADDAGPSIGS